ncbi:hypothetical protein C8K44_104293 [Aminobacter sp. AP02]|nr:hypothetical protein C8K44_104293 [Aminobacter sp. AP02]
MTASWKCQGERAVGLAVRGQTECAKSAEHTLSRGCLTSPMAMRSIFEDWAADTGISKWTLTGTTRAGKSVEVQGCDFYTSRAGKVIR